MAHPEFLQYFTAALHQLRTEIEAYPDDDAPWRTTEGISNSGGTLCRHLTGNLHHYVGHGMGNTGYVRDRPAEFSVRGLRREELVQDIESTREMLAEVLPAVNLDAAYPDTFWGQPMSHRGALLKLLAHLNYHLGQVNYHRRLVGK